MNIPHYLQTNIKSFIEFYYEYKEKFFFVQPEFFNILPRKLINEVIITIYKNIIEKSPLHIY